MLFCSGQPKSMRMMMKVLGRYEVVSGEMINIDKRYAIFYGRKNKGHFEDLIRKVAKRMIMWQNRFLMFGGRTSTSSLWSGYIWNKYYKKYHPIIATGWGSSYVLRKIIGVRDKVEHNIWWKIKAGTSIFLFDNWTRLGALYYTENEDVSEEKIEIVRKKKDIKTDFDYIWNNGLPFKVSFSHGGYGRGESIDDDLKRMKIQGRNNLKHGGNSTFNGMVMQVQDMVKNLVKSIGVLLGKEANRGHNRNRLFEFSEDDKGTMEDTMGIGGKKRKGRKRLQGLNTTIIHTFREAKSVPDLLAKEENIKNQDDEDKHSALRITKAATERKTVTTQQ
ncbi:hypothetical protein H5410_003638 [Solanum commersonii]|uniref:Uncharacterized protein n=1 Tax=Solanum commersonii TaxID=4109 RepID=A0A9J6B5G3_SOLCO|nr:hypothetical protein H5410_003638 [Solanum commersonii]